MPLLVCLTPVKNEAWILHAFLKATSIWADYIIIADQNSTDGSREIAKQYSKVILLENNNEYFNESERQSLLINSARQIEGDKILFGLDADEILSANFIHSNDWKKILESIPGDVFWFKWANVSSSLNEFWESETYFPWLFHDNGTEPHENYVRKMHSMRIPYPIDEKQMYYVNDFYVLHFGFTIPQKIYSKTRFYKLIDFELNNRHFIRLDRNYYFSNESNLRKKKIIAEMMFSIDSYDFDILKEIDFNLDTFWYDEFVLNKIIKTNQFNKLNIWDANFLIKYKIKDKRSFYTKIIHKYLNYTNRYKENIFIKFIDKVLMIF